jgi:pyruvate/2-oxoglutarate dehydrogenase complex dihydrolipoamide dehydrogenase (E3) component
MHEGVICVERISGVNDVHPLDLHNIPSCTYCRPQVASVGLTEKAAREAGHEVKIGHFPFIGNGRAIALGEPEGTEALPRNGSCAGDSVLSGRRTLARASRSTP